MIRMKLILDDKNQDIIDEIIYAVLKSRLTGTIVKYFTSWEPINLISCMLNMIH